jgi:hypothetical protein
MKKLLFVLLCLIATKTVIKNEGYGENYGSGMYSSAVSLNIKVYLEGSHAKTQRSKVAKINKLEEE